MKITNFTMINALETLNKCGGKKLPQKISYAITKNMILLNKEYEVYEIELQKIFKEYESDFLKTEKGEIVFDDRGVPVVHTDRAADYQEKILDLLSIEIDIELHKIDLNCFDYDDRYDVLSANEMINLQSIICKQDI